MASLRLNQLESIERLRAAADAWDDLWRRSETTIPTVRAELVALWLETYAPTSPFCALVVEQDGRMVGALPLVEKKIGRMIRGGGLTANYWSPNGNLLLDPDTDVERAAALLADGMESLDWPLFWFDMVPNAMTGWKALLCELSHRGLSVDVHHRWDVGRIALDDDVEAYFAARSKNLRRSLRKDAHRLEEQGPLEFCFEEHFSYGLVEKRLDEIFTVEDRSWKGDAGSSVMQNSTALEFYRQQARRLAEWDLLRVARLRHAGRTIAFDLGWIGSGTYHSYKIGYDPEYGSFGPGHLLRERQIRELVAKGDIQAIDFQGPMTRALRSWATDSYPIARVVVAQRRLSSRALFASYHAAARAVRLARKFPRPW